MLSGITLIRNGIETEIRIEKDLMIDLEGDLTTDLKIEKEMTEIEVIAKEEITDKELDPRRNKEILFPFKKLELCNPSKEISNPEMDSDKVITTNTEDREIFLQITQLCCQEGYLIVV
jgi:hypothetical protein